MPNQGLGVSRTCTRAVPARTSAQTPLFGLLDSLYGRVNGVWEERFERTYGFWRGLVDEVVARYLGMPSAATGRASTGPA
jgi:hypothetical protein